MPGSHCTLILDDPHPLTINTSTSDDDSIRDISVHMRMPAKRLCDRVLFLREIVGRKSCQMTDSVTCEFVPRNI